MIVVPKKKILDLTNDGTIRWRVTIERMYQLGELKPYFSEMSQAEAKLGEFDLEWTRGGEIEVSYLGMLITKVSCDDELKEAIEQNGAETVKKLEDEFLNLLGEI